MAGETTLTPVAADISPTVISGVKERSTRWIAALTAAPDGFTLADINHRQRVAISLLQLSVDHHVSLRLLIDAEMLPSARALYRPQIEAYLRGLWAHLCASEAQLERFLQSGALPRLDDMLAALKALDHELWSPLFQVKRQIWRRLCDETHGGLQQVLSRVSPNEIGRRFSSEEAIRYLMASTSASYLAGIGLAAVLADERLTRQLQKTFHNIFADDVAE